MERKTKIIATIGPSSKSKEVLRMLLPYVDYARLNFSWGNHQEMAEMIASIREVATELAKTIPIIQDLSGPREQTDLGHTLDTKQLEVITDKDKDDIVFGIEQQVEYVALSYVTSAQDIIDLRSLCAGGMQLPKIIAKIERREAVKNIDSIIKASDGVMIARGDLGLQYPIEQIPFIQKYITKRSNEAKCFVVVATEVFLSMCNTNRPTRAEVTDVLFAISHGADAIMLSDETAKGSYPIEAVSILDRLITYDESHATYE